MSHGRSGWMSAAALVITLAGCSDEPSATPEPTAPAVTICEPGEVQPADRLPNVADIDAALDAVEAEFGDVEVEYFEVNATIAGVNLFVALNGGTVAQQYLWAEGELSSAAGQEASGGTFTRADLDFEPASVLETIREELPDTFIETFYVNGDGSGAVKYAVLAVAQCGGGLEIVIDKAGTILSVEPL